MWYSVELAELTEKFGHIVQVIVSNLTTDIVIHELVAKLWRLKKNRCCMNLSSVWLRQTEAYLRDMGMTRLASV